MRNLSRNDYEPRSHAVRIELNSDLADEPPLATRMTRVAGGGEISVGPWDVPYWVEDWDGVTGPSFTLLIASDEETRLSDDCNFRNNRFVLTHAQIAAEVRRRGL